MQNNKAAGRQLPPRTKKPPSSRSFFRLESGQSVFQCVIELTIIHYQLKPLPIPYGVIAVIVPKSFQPSAAW